MPNVNDTFFDGHYKEIWRSIIPDELTAKEIDFMLPYFNLRPGSEVLDLMCGYGRHALALASKGIQVTAVDNLPHYTAELKTKAAAAHLPVEVITTGVLQFVPAKKYDLAICMGNSLNFFDAADTVKIFRMIAESLKEDGQLLINSWSIAEISFKNFSAKSWSQVGNLKYLVESNIIFHPTRLETISTIIASDGATEVKEAVDYIFSLNEMEAMLAAAGLKLKEVYSIPGRKKFSIGEPRAYMIAGK